MEKIPAILTHNDLSVRAPWMHAKCADAHNIWTHLCATILYTISKFVIMSNQNDVLKVETIIAKTLKELISDLSKVNPVKSTLLSKEIEGLSDRKITRKIQKKDSDLVKNIPKDLLQNDASGRRYLDILSILQPALKPPKPAAPPIKEALLQPAELQLKQKQSATSLTPRGKTTEEIKEKCKAIGLEIDDSILSLAETFREATGMSEKEIASAVQAGDFSKLMTLASKCIPLVQEKVESGEIDLEKTQEQFLKSAEQMTENPNFAEFFKSNPQMATMVKTIAKSCKDGSAPDLDPSVVTGLLGGLQGSSVPKDAQAEDLYKKFFD